MGLADGTPVAVASLFLDAGIDGVYSVGTLPAARRRGYGAAVTLAALAHARDVGYRIASLWASAQGESVYRRLGFRPFGQIVLWRWSASS